jgi:hypothetical protein
MVDLVHHQVLLEEQVVLLVLELGFVVVMAVLELG